MLCGCRNKRSGVVQAHPHRLRWDYVMALTAHRTWHFVIPGWIGARSTLGEQAPSLLRPQVWQSPIFDSVSTARQWLTTTALVRVWSRVMVACGPVPATHSNSGVACLAPGIDWVGDMTKPGFKKLFSLTNFGGEWSQVWILASNQFCESFWDSLIIIN